MEWPTVEVAGVWDDAAHYRITWLENELEKARATSVGRGLAIAIQLLDPEAYGDSTAVVMESLRRYEEGKKE
jgi:hypothetical protein